MREIRDRAEALRVYCHKHDGLLEAHNRLAGIIARCERRIGQELRAVGLQPGRPVENGSEGEPFSKPTLADLGFEGSKGKRLSAAYQDMASVEETVILDAIAIAGAEGREVTKKDIRNGKALVADAGELLLWAQGKVGGMLGETSPGKRHDKEPSPRGEGLDHNARHRYRDMAKIGADEPEPIDPEVARWLRMIAATELPKHGVVGNGRSRGSHRTSTRGETSSYLAARLKRDHPEIAAAYDRGEKRDFGEEEARALAGHGGDRRSEQARKDQERNPALEKHRGETRMRTLARLRRDDPDLAARVERGELTANKAAVDKGWRKKRSA